MFYNWHWWQYCVQRGIDLADPTITLIKLRALKDWIILTNEWEN